MPLSDESDESDKSDKSDRRAKHGHQALPSTCAYLRGTSAEVLFLWHLYRIGRAGIGAPEGCHSASPWSRHVVPKTGGLEAPQSNDPCGRTSLSKCDHKGRLYMPYPFHAGRSGASAPLRHGGYLSGTLSGADGVPPIREKPRRGFMVY